jgi:hypothetical protein
MVRPVSHQKLDSFSITGPVRRQAKRLVHAIEGRRANAQGNIDRVAACEGRHVNGN